MTRRQDGDVTDGLIRNARIHALRTAQEALAGEDTVAWARKAKTSTIALSEAMAILDDLIEDEEERD